MKQVNKQGYDRQRESERENLTWLRIGYSQRTRLCIAVHCRACVCRCEGKKQCPERPDVCPP